MAAVPKTVLLDTNVAAAWCFSEPGTPLAAAVEKRAREGTIILAVPSLFWAEFQHVCKGKLAPARGPALARDVVEMAYAELRAFGLIEIEGELVRCRDAAWQYVLSLNLGSYDAYFCAVAVERDLELWTLDEPLWKRTRSHAGLCGLVRLLGHDLAL